LVNNRNELMIIDTSMLQ